MNARTELQQAAPTLQSLPLAAIAPSQTDIQVLRRHRFDVDKITELAESIRTNGIVQPIVVRPRDAQLSTLRDAPLYEIVAGERRWRAAEIAGLTHIPAIARDLTDDQVLEVQLVENLQRDELLPLEEAHGYRELMRIKSIKAEDVGELVGKSRSWVYARLKLLDLPESARNDLQTGRLDASRALLVARIADPKRQEKALKLATERDWRGEYLFSYRALREQLEKAGATVNLKTAPFRRDDGSFWLFTPILGKRGQEDVEAIPACDACPKRDADVCTDVACYQAKVKQHGERVKKAAADAGKPVLTGEAAKAIAPRKDKLVGYLDLAEPCDYDLCEEEPLDLRDVREGESAKDHDARIAAYEERAAAFRERTYRELLESAGLEVTLIEDPKTKAIRELVPFKAAAKVLDEVYDIQVPSYIAEPERGPVSNPADYKAEQARRAAEEQAHRAREEKELEARRRVLLAIAEKPHGALTREELVDIADVLLDSWKLNQGLKTVYTKLPEPGQLKDAELTKLIRLALVAEAVIHTSNSPYALYALAKRMKIDVAKVKAGKEAAATPTKKKAPAKKPTKAKRK